MSNYGCLRENFIFSKFSEEQKLARVVRVSEIIFDKINALGIDTFDGFDEAHGVISIEHSIKLQNTSEKWMKSHIGKTYQPVYVQVVMLYVTALAYVAEESLGLHALDMMSVISNILDDGRMDLITYGPEYVEITNRRVGYDIVWNMFNDAG